MRNDEALKIFNDEFGQDLAYTMSSLLKRVPEFKENPGLFKHNIRIIYQLGFPEEHIPLFAFTTVGELVNWVTVSIAEEQIYKSACSQDQQQLNIIITGRSGAGKSSFLNYLINRDVFRTGVGDPVTSLYFEEYRYNSSETGVTYHLFDTKGIEPTTTNECKNKVINKIRRSDEYTDIFKWIHTVYYCFDASAKRIQPFEISFIKDLLRETAVVILLTKKDLVTESALNDLIKQIKNDIGTSVQIIPVCSVEARTRKGVAVRSGREDVLKASFLGLWNKMSQVYPLKQIEFLIAPSRSRKLDLLGIKGLSDYEQKEMKEMFASRVDAARKLTNAYLSLDYLCNYPDLSDLFLDDLQSINRADIEKLMSKTNLYINDISCSLALMNVDKLWKNNEKMHENVFNFYKKLNKEKPQVLYSHQSKDALLELKNYNLKEQMAVLDDFAHTVSNRLDDVEGCWFSSSSEKAYARKAYSIYRDKVKSIANDLKVLAEKFVVAYKAELYQYGQCCIRKDAEETNQGPVTSEGDLNANEKTYFNVVLDSLRDHTITPEERVMLDRMRENMGIQPMRAGLIEDYIRYHKLKQHKNG